MSNIVLKADKLSKKFNISTKGGATLYSSIRSKLSGESSTRELWALKDINISISKGEMAAIIGPNGAGKTTLLRILAGIMFPTSGTYEVKEDVSCMFELGLGFNPRFSAIENVFLYAALHGISKREIEKKFPAIIDLSGLGDFMDAKLSEFSSGMRARLAFATIIQTIKGIIMVDELLAVGDAAFQKRCIKEFEIAISNGNTVLFVSHAPGGLINMCNKALYLDRGEQIAFGEPKAVYELYYKEKVDKAW